MKFSDKYSRYVFSIWAVQFVLAQGCAASDLTAEQFYARADRESAAGRDQAAIDDYTAAIRKDSHLWKAFANRSASRYNVQDYQGALSDINIGIAHLPPMQSLFDLKATIEKALSRGAAQSRALEARRLAARQMLLNAQLGGDITDPDYQLMRIAQAARARGGAVPIGMVNPYATNALLKSTPTVLLSSPDRGIASGGVNSAKATETLSAQQYFDRACEKANSIDLKGAIADYDECVRLDPAYAQAFANRGLAKFNLGDQKGASDDLNRAADLVPNNSSVKALRDRIINAGS